MVFIKGFKLITAALCASVSVAPALAAPLQQAAEKVSVRSTSSYWLANIQQQGTAWPSSGDNYTIFRNVQDYGATGDGSTDDTDAINEAISAGNRCGDGCQSSTTTPAIIYFPPGTYVVSKPIQMYYYTQVIGDAVDIPIVQASSTFSGMAVFDADPYGSDGNWFVNQNNFFRQVRNFEIDLTQTTAGTGIHWQVAQATSLQNIVFKMTTGGQQQGIFMDNGSGGFFSNLTFIGGKYGAFLGSQQFTTRDLIFQDCETAIYMNWNWGWTLHGVTITGSTVGVDMASSPSNQTVGSVVISDSQISATYGVNSSFSTSGNVPATGGTLIIDNVDLSGTTEAAVWSAHSQSAILAPGKITAWAQGNGYTKTSSADVAQGTISAPSKASALLDSNGNIYSRVRPQYETYSASNIMSAKSNGCAGDGSTDDTSNVQNFLNKVAQTSGAVAYFDHGAYLVKDTIVVPDNIKITGEIWPYILADSASFNDASNPKAVFQVGSSSGSDSGAVEISDLIFETNGPAPGAIMIEWNLVSSQGDSGMWDTHVRIGGSAGTNLQSTQCPGDPTTEPSSDCYGVFLMFHATPQSGGVYLENTWFWVADHDMEINNQTQTSIYSARGALFESGNGPTWLWGTASEHSMFYNYQFSNISSENGIFGGFMQSETPYFAPNPTNPGPFSYNSNYDDPTFSNCGDSSSDQSACAVAWGLRVSNSQNVLLYSTGFYSFFDNYSQACVGQQNCQENMIDIENSDVYMYAVTTKAAVNMLVDTDLQSPITDAANRDVYGATLAWYSNE